LFLLLPALLAVGWFWPRLRLQRPLRALALLLLVFLATQPQTRRFSDGLDLWVLVDQSDSARELLAPKLPEWETLLTRSKAADDRLRFIDFATEAVPRGAQIRSGADGQKYAGPTHSTRLNSATLLTLSQLDPNRASRLLVLTDGASTEPLDGLADRLIAQDVPLDYRLAARAGVPRPLRFLDARPALLGQPPRAHSGRARSSRQMTEVAHAT
jgi:hypothetical protein